MTEDFTGNDTGDAGGQAADSGPGGEKARASPAPRAPSS